MNTELREMIVGAEGRFLSDEEHARIREYATGMAARLDTARRVQQREARLVDGALSRLEAEHPDLVAQQGDRDRVAEQLGTTLRYCVQAHVRKDMAFFRECYSEWFAELLCTLSAPKDVLDTALALREACREHLDATDQRALAPYLDEFVRELEDWQVEG